jgi:hypothetical protein
MNPCLSGWERGEDKYRYMHLCHRVLSRSQFNAVLKLREAGINTSNLVSLPNLSNISLPIMASMSAWQRQAHRALAGSLFRIYRKR